MKQIFQQLTKGSLFLILIGTGIFFKSGPFITVGISLLFLLAFERYTKYKIPTSFSFLFVGFVVLSLILGSQWNFYEKYPWWDDMLHFTFGIGFAFIGYLIIYIFLKNHQVVKSPIIIMIFSMCFCIAIGALWEIFEYTMDVFFGMNMQRTIPDKGIETVTKYELAAKYGVHDTMHDIILETFSALITNLYIYAHISLKQSNWVTRLTDKFLIVNRLKK